MIGTEIVTDGNWVLMGHKNGTPHEFLEKGESVVVVWSDGHKSCPFVVGLASDEKAYGSYISLRKK